MSSPITFERRGSKTLMALLILRLLPSLLVFLALIIFSLFRDPFIALLSTNGSEDQAIKTFSFIIQTGFGLFALIAGISVLIAIIEYYSLSFSIEENSFRIKEGIINLREQSITYRQIQNIDISRPLLYRLLGMCRIVILTAGSEDNQRPTTLPNDNDSELVIDLLDQVHAETLQHELLERSHIQVVSNTSLPPIDLHTN